MLYDVIIIGGGPAGLAAATRAYDNGLRKILILERDKELGGILNQCIHNGFGLQRFKEELTGPEFSYRFVEKVKEYGIEYKLESMVLHITEDKKVHVISPEGYQILETKTIIIACGCREKSRGAIQTPGDRCAGVFTAGAAQKYLNIDGFLVGKRVVILGSGDIGLIMARRMTLEGAKVLAVLEINPYTTGLQRNIQQCLNDFDIPLYLSHTVVDIKGKNRVEQVTMAEVDSSFKPIKGTEVTFDCDTLLLSVGLIPENEISKEVGIKIDPRTRGPRVTEDQMTSIDGIFACGNVVQVHDLADNVAIEAEKAADGAYDYITKARKFETVEVVASRPLTYSVPQMIHKDMEGKFVSVSARVSQVIDKKKFVLKNEKDEVLREIPIDYLITGEMTKIMILKSDIDKCESKLVIEVA